MLSIKPAAATKEPPILTVELCWQVLLQLKEIFKNNSEPIDSVYVDFANAEIYTNLHSLPLIHSTTPMVILMQGAQVPAGGSECLSCSVGKDLGLSFKNTHHISPELFQFLKLYLPYVMANYLARLGQKVFTVSHFAQSLDGKIATNIGHSKWIGCSKNLEHAHRMRALCDAVIIGANTLKYDEPRLTVRHVAGNSPKRIIVGTSCNNFDSLLAASTDPIYVLGLKESNQVNIQALPETIKGPADLLAYLKDELDIHSVYVEGGSQLTSSFLKANSLDMVQLHISPKILGSGIDSFALAPIDFIEEGIEFTDSFYQLMGDGVLFSGRVVKKC